MRVISTGRQGEPTRAPVAIDEQRLAADGWCTVRLLDAPTVDELAARYDAVPGTNDTIFITSVDGDRTTSRTEDLAIKRALRPALERLAPDQEPFLAAFIVKGVDGGAIEIHQDWTYVDERTHRTWLFWCPLVDVDETSGTLWVVPGSHRWDPRIRGSGAIVSLAAETQDDLWAAATPVALHAGEAIVYDAALLHGSRPTNGTFRPVVAVATAPTGVPLLHAHQEPGAAPELFTVDEAWFSTHPFGERPSGYPTTPAWTQVCTALTSGEVAAHLGSGEAPYDRPITSSHPPTDLTRTGAHPPTSGARRFVRSLLRRRRQGWSAPPGPVLAAPRRSESGPTMVDSARQDELERFGFTVVPLLDPDLLAEVRRTNLEVGPAPDDPKVALNWSFHSRSREHKESVKQLLPLVRPALASALTDHDAYLTTFITKWPGPHSAFPPHQDPSLVDERRFTGVTVWVPLIDVDAENGMLHVVPGSHRFSDALRGQDVDRSPFADLEAAVIERCSRGVPVAAGEALVFDNRLLHFSAPNRSDGPRVVLSLGMRPSVSRCVVVVPGTDDEVEVHEVPDDFYIDVLPALRDRWAPSDAPIARVANPQEHWTEDDFVRLCDLVGPAPRTVVVDASQAAADTFDPGVFCALCGSSDGLDETDRAGRTNAQLVCPSCAATLAAEEAMRTDG